MARTPITFETKPFDTKLGRQVFGSGSLATCIFTATRFKPDGTYEGETEELIVGVGINAVMFSQDFNVELVRSMGWADIIQPVTHSVANNQIRISKMTDINRLLSAIGVAALGMDNLMSPNLNVTLVNTAWSAPLFQRNGATGKLGATGPLGKAQTDWYYWKAHDLHLTSNSINAQTGQIITENTSFVAAKFTPRPADEYSRNLYKRFATMYPQFYSNNGSAQQFEEYTFEN